MAEATPPTPSAPATPSRLRFFIVLVAAVGAAFSGSALATCMWNTSRAVVPKASTQTTVLRDTPSVVVAIRQLARLETTSFHIERVIDLKDRQSHMFGLVQGDDAILLIAAGDVVAGVDLSQMAEADVTYGADGKSARVVLPEPTVFSTRLDNKRTYVHSRTTDAFAKRGDSLETRARQLAEQSLEQAALQAGILQQARANAVRTLTTLLHSLDFKNVEVVFAAQ